MHDEFPFKFRGRDYTVHVIGYTPSQSATYDEPGYGAEIEFEVFRGRHLVNAKRDADAILRMYEDELREAKQEEKVSRYESRMEDAW